MDLAEWRHMIEHAGPVRGPERWVLHTIIPISPVTDDHVEIRPPYLTSVPMIMSHTGIKTARTVNKHLDALVAAGREAGHPSPRPPVPWLNDSYRTPRHRVYGERQPPALLRQAGGWVIGG